MRINRIKIIAVIFIAVLALLATTVDAGMNSFRSGVAGLLQTEFTAAQTNRITEAFAETYRAEFENAVNANTVANTAAGRRQFAAEKITEFVTDTTRRHEQSKIVAPTPTPIP